MHILTSLRTFHQTIKKRQKALYDPVDLHDYIENENFNVISSPFPHIYVDNIFTKEVNEKLWRHFQQVLSRGFTKENDSNKFHPFLNLRGEYEYDGYLYVPKPDEEPALKVFFSLPWNLLFSKIFKQPTGWCTSLAYHYHLAGDRTGFVHHDFAEKWFSPSDRLTNGIIFRDTGYTKLPGAALTFPETRRIALIYYLNNRPWEADSGGETGLYQSKNGPLAKLVAPQNNRLLAFQISHHSFHAFQTNLQPRPSIVQWFHAPFYGTRDDKNLFLK